MKLMQLHKADQRQQEKKNIYSNKKKYTITFNSIIKII